MAAVNKNRRSYTARGWRRGVAVILVVLIVIAAIITALQIYSFSRNVYRNTARSSFGTTAEYLAEAAVEEGFWLLQTECNKPGSELHRIFREQQSEGVVPYAYQPDRLFARMQAPESAETFKPYPIDRIETSMEIRFSRESVHPMEPFERSGEVQLTAVVRPLWGRGEETYRRVQARKPFRVQLITPPQTYDRRALTLYKPDYINGASKQALDTDIIEPTNKAIDDTNTLNNGYETAVNDRRTKVNSCSTCKQTQKFMKMTISSGARIPADFFKDESILIGNPDRNPLEKLSDFNYESILRDMFPPLYQIYQTIYTVSNINLQVYRVIGIVLIITDMLRYVPYVGQAMQAIHTALDAVATAQEMIGKITVIALKVILEGVIIGQPTDALREAGKGNFAPALDGIQTSVSDVQASGALDKMKGEGTKLESSGGKANAALASDSGATGSATPGGTNPGTGAGTGAGTGTGTSPAPASGQPASDQARLDQVQKDKVFFEKAKQDDPEAKEKAAGYEKRFKGLDGLKNEINADNIMGLLGGMMSKGEFAKAGPLDKLGTDSDMAMLTGLIKGFVKGHRAYYSTELLPGGDLYAYFAREMTKFYEEFYLQRASFVLRDQAEWDAFLARHRDTGVNGIVYVGRPAAASSDPAPATTPLVVDLDGFRGKAVLYSTDGFEIKAATLKDPQVDTLSLVTPGNIKLPTGQIQAALAAVPRDASGPGEGGAVEFSGDADLFGSLLVRRYTVDDNKRTGPKSVKGKLEFNPLLSAEGPKGFRTSHLWVTFSPVERGREVFLK
ncbi:MAG: hypothetical protein HY816_13265 [Candidatus Wallbacteria bacterium]|nr:hypothetical protein [Candidatus Wallbacteria bacterium]